MKPTEQIALWADKLRDLSAMGLLYSKNIHDETAFRSVQTIAMEMLAVASGTDWQEVEPLRSSLFSRPTPLVGGDGALIDEDGRILLIQRADNHLWAMPGGAFEVGETPVEGVMREVLEETGMRCRVSALVGVFDSRFCGTVGPHHLYHFVFLCTPLGHATDTPLHAGVEVLDSGWFREDELPAELDPGHRSRIPDAFRVWRGDRRVFLDNVGRVQV